MRCGHWVKNQQLLRYGSEMGCYWFVTDVVSDLAFDRLIDLIIGVQADERDFTWLDFYSDRFLHEAQVRLEQVRLQGQAQVRHEFVPSWEGLQDRQTERGQRCCKERLTALEGIARIRLSHCLAPDDCSSVARS